MSCFKKTFWLSLCSAFLLPAPAFAIVNVEQAIIGRPAEGLHTTLDLLASGASGNTDKSAVNVNLLSLWQHGANTEYLQVRYAYGKSNGKTDTDNAFVHLRHRTAIGENWGVEEFVQTGRDRFARLARRTLLGGGLRSTLFEEEQKSALYLGLGAFYEWERLNYVPGTTDVLRKQLWRANSYLIWKRQFNEQVRFNNTLYYQPALADTANYRVLEQALMLVKLDENLDFKVSLDVAYNSQPPQTVKKRDVLYSTGLQFSF
jgi:putative salt-induced outer membrane protein YdiY